MVDPALLAALLQRIEASPYAGSLRLEACVLANQLAMDTGEACYSDVAESLAEEEVPGATRVLRAGLAEQAALAARVRRVLCTTPQRARPYAETGPGKSLSAP